VSERLCGGSVGAVRVAAISDIHGNLPALEAVLEEIERERVDSVVVVGDTIIGPSPVEVFDAVAGLGGHVVRGNAEDEVVRRSTRFGPLATWCADLLGEERLATAAAWPLTLELDVEGVGRVLVCHSTPASDEPIYTSITPEHELLQLLGPLDADVLLCGHTHMQYDRTLSSGLRVVNPGSVGMPYEGKRGAFWAVLGPDGVDFRNAEYDVEAAAAAMRASGAPDIEELQIRHLLDPPDPRETTEFFESQRGS
jgi:putative phosphoesterase